MARGRQNLRGGGGIGTFCVERPLAPLDAPSDGSERAVRGEAPGLVDVTALLVTRWVPVDDPQIFDICLGLAGGLDRRTTETVRELARSSLHRIDTLRDEVLSQNSPGTELRRFGERRRSQTLVLLARVVHLS